MGEMKDSLVDNKKHAHKLIRINILKYYRSKTY